MRCDKCRTEMRVRDITLLGESVKAKVCPKCGYRLVNANEAIRLQEKVVPRIHVEKRIIRLGDSSAVTIPRQLKGFFAPGARVILDFVSGHLKPRKSGHAS